MTWYNLNRKASPTAASTTLYNQMNADKVDVINLGQGRETAELPLLTQLTSEIKGITISSGYPTPPQDLEKSLEAWTSRFLGIDGVCAGAFALQGRFGLDRSFHHAALVNGFKKDASVLGPNTSWPMVKDLVEDYGQTLSLFPMERGQIASHVKTVLASNPNIVAVYINSPHNPTGMRVSNEDMQAVMNVLEEVNATEQVTKRNGQKIFFIVDNPYFHACAQSNDGKAHLDSGIQGVLVKTTNTPWIMDISFSKAFGLANPGFSALIAHPEVAAILSGRFLRTAKIGYVKELFAAFNQSLQIENDQAVLAHFADLYTKYQANWASLNQALGDYVVDGDAGMTALLALPRAEFTGCVVKGDNDAAYPINETNDLVEWLANKHGVVTVNNDDPDHPNDKILLRLAASASPSKYAEAIQRLSNAFAEINQNMKVAA